MREQGFVVVKALVDPGIFPSWCLAHGKKPDADGRMAYAHECATDKWRARQEQKAEEKS